MMPPKAKAKAKARVGAVLRRPAHRRGGLRRPAGAGDGQSPWALGQEVDLHQVPPMELGPGTWLVASKANYFGATVKFAGEVVKLEVEQGEVTLQLRATGTDNEHVLRAHSAQPQQVFRGHVCPEGCGMQETGDYIIHLLRGRKADLDHDDPWIKNLQAGKVPEEVGDELGALRARSQALQLGGLPGMGGPPPEGQEGLPGAKEKEASPVASKKKKKKKEEKKSKGVTDGRYPAVAVQKDLKDLFGGTGMDPRERVRRRVMTKAQKFISRKRTKSSAGSSNSSSSSSSTTVEDPKGLESIFMEQTKVKGVAERYPGALTMEMVGSMREALLTSAGEEMEESAVRPTALLYYRSVLSKRASGAQARELLNISTALDHLLRGRAASAADVLSQRLKAQEAVCQGTAWSIAMRMEVPPPEMGGLAGRTELKAAQKEDYEESRARWRSQSAASGKGDGKTKGKGPKGDKEGWRREETRPDNREKKGKGQEKKG